MFLDHSCTLSKKCESYLEEWARVDSQRTRTLRHDESFEAQNEGQRLGRIERQRNNSRHQAPVHDVSKALLTGYYSPDDSSHARKPGKYFMEPVSGL